MPDDILAVFRSAPGPRPDGAELSLSRRLRHPPEKVWAALTLPVRLEAWMGIEWLGGEAPLTVGGPFTYRFANTDMQSVGRVLRLEPPRLLEHTWFENVTPGTVIAWMLEEDGSGTRLTLTQRFGVADDAARNAAGWTEILRGLDHHLDGGTMAEWSPGDWRALRDGYAAELGEEATRDGRLIELEGGPALRFVRILRHAPKAVWTALTDPYVIPRWMQADAIVESRVGGRFQLDFHGMSHVGRGEVLAFDPPRRFSFTWPERVDIDLEPHASGTRLILVARLTKASEAVDNAGGWHWHLDALDRALTGEAVVLDMDRVKTLEKIYTATLADEGT